MWKREGRAVIAKCLRHQSPLWVFKWYVLKHCCLWDKPCSLIMILYLSLCFLQCQPLPGGCILFQRQGNADHVLHIRMSLELHKTIRMWSLGIAGLMLCLWQTFGTALCEDDLVVFYSDSGVVWGESLFESENSIVEYRYGSWLCSIVHAVLGM